MTITEQQLEIYRELATHLLDYACCGDRGRPEGDPVYDFVTEGRDRGAMRAKYSSCGDLAHWLLYRLGVRLSFVNRSEHNGWRSGVNLTLLQSKSWYGSNALASGWPNGSPYLGAGDILIVNGKYGPHCICVVGFDKDRPSMLHTAEYGQPGGKLKTHEFVPAFTNTIKCVLRLKDVLNAAEESGQLGTADALPLRHWLTETEYNDLLDRCVAEEVHLENL